MLRMGFVGDGGIAKGAQAVLGADFQVVASLVSKGGSTRDHGGAWVDSIEDMIALRPDIIVECAGHSVVQTMAGKVLRAGVPMLIVSIGALADRRLHEELLAAEADGPSRIILPAGAIGGVDALAAARLGGLSRVRYRARKPATAWKGTPAEETHDLDSLTEPTVFFKGNAREAALMFPKNSNVAATVALHGVGFEATSVELIADPTTGRNVHEIEIEGTDGLFRFEIEGNPSAENPKTSMLTAHSVALTLIEFARATGAVR